MEKSEFAGKWRVIEAMDFDDDYLRESPDPHIFIEVKGEKDVLGSYHIDLQDGDIGGHFEKDCEGNLQLIFTFEGSDEMESVSGYGTASFEAPDVMLLRMHHHLGDTYSYRCKHD